MLAERDPSSHKTATGRCGAAAQGGDLSDWQNPETHVLNNLYYHSRAQQNFYDIQTDPWQRLESDRNLFYSTTADTAWRHKYRSRASTLTDWQEYSGKDTDSVWKDPEFVRPIGTRPKDFKRKAPARTKDVEGSKYGPVCGAYVSGEEIVGVEPERRMYNQ